MKNFFLKDKKGQRLLIEGLSKFKAADMVMTPEICATTIILDIDSNRENLFHFKGCNEIIDIKTEFELISAFRRYIIYSITEEKNDNLGHILLEIFNFFRKCKTKTFLCNNKKEVNLMNRLVTDLSIYFKNFINHLNVNDIIDIEQYNHFSGYISKRVFKRKDQNFDITPTKSLVDIPYEYQISHQTETFNDIKVKKSIRIKQLDHIKMFKPYVEEDLLEINQNFIEPKMDKTSKFDTLDCRIKLDTLNGFKFNHGNVCEIIDLSRDMKYMYSRIIGAYMNTNQEKEKKISKIIKKKDSNRLIQRSRRRLFFRNAKKVECKVTEFTDGSHLLIEPIKKYGSAFLVIKKEDVQDDGLVLWFKWNNVKRLYHTEKNLDYIMKNITISTIL